MNYNKIIRDAIHEHVISVSKPLPKPRAMREPSLAEQNAEYIPYGYHALFCFHDILYFAECGKCKRTKADAFDNLRRYVNEHPS